MYHLPRELNYLSQVKNLPDSIASIVILMFALMPLVLSAGGANNPCVQGSTFHIVVLGSSTAAGAGPSHPDSTWVNRYRKFIQSINPLNQVTNLAQGGTTTYHIMPDWYTAPAGRPAANTARNVSEAIRLQADAIIVNMPSNDAALGFTINEHMANFNAIVNSADSAGIPVWICTTQPRNFSAVKRQLQMDVRDSIFAQFGLKAIDFWTGFADTLGGIDSVYDSGDGVHMNDHAHRILFQRVQAKNILSELTDTLSKPDHFIIDIGHRSLACGSAQDSVWIRISNRGMIGGYDLPVRWRIKDLTTGLVSLVYDSIVNGVNTCDQVRRSVVINTTSGGSWQVSAHLETINDSISSNDHSDTVSIQRVAPPKVISMDQNVCRGEMVTLWATGGDTTLWLDGAGGILGYGDSLRYGPLFNSDTVVARVLNGDLHFTGQLVTHNNSNIDWNGIMFDLIATDTIEVDSLALRPSQLGPTEVTARYRNGSYKGHESNAGAWSMWGTDSVQPAAIGDLAVAQFGSRSMYPGDTLGVYLSMQNGSSLKYRSLSSEASYADAPLELISGSGISNGFSATYFPRAWSGEVYFHYGFNPNGDCSADTSVVADIFPNYLNLGPDTTLAFNEQLALSLPVGFSDVLWSTGDTLSLIQVDSSMAGSSNQVLIWVQGTDIFGCSLSDTILVKFVSGLGLNKPDTEWNISVYPNPAGDRVTVINPSGQTLSLSVFNSTGQIIDELRLQPGDNVINLSLDPGMYLLHCLNHPAWSQLLQID